MALDFSALLSPEEKKAAIERRIKDFAFDAFGHELNKKTLLANTQVDQTSEEVVNTAAAIDANLATIESSIVTLQSELAAIPSNPE